MGVGEGDVHWVECGSLHADEHLALAELLRHRVLLEPQRFGGHALADDKPRLLGIWDRFSSHALFACGRGWWWLMEGTAHHGVRTVYKS